MAPWVADDDGLRAFLEKTAPLEPKRKAVPSKASSCLRSWFENAHDDDIYYILALLERHGPQSPETLAAMFLEIGAEGAEELACLDDETVGIFELCDLARSPNLLLAVAAGAARAVLQVYFNSGVG